MKREKYKIAAAGPFTGNRSAYGKMLKDSSERAESKYWIKNIYFDDVACPHQAVHVANQIVELGLTMVIGHFNSFCAEAVAPIYERNGIALVLPAATKRNLTNFKNVYRVCPHEDSQAGAFVEIIRRYGFENIAVLIDDSRYGKYLYNELKKKILIKNIFKSALEFKAESSCQAVIILGIHISMADMINKLDSIKPIHMYCCDDALVDEFFYLTKNSPHKIKVVGPKGGYCECISLAYKIAGKYIAQAQHVHILDYLDDCPFFDIHGEYIHQECQILEHKLNF